MKNKLPSSFYNPITLVGAFIAVLNFGLILFLIVLDALASENNPYLGIITFIILPSFLVFGLLLIAYGIYRENKKIQSGEKKRILPTIDFNNPKHRLGFTIFSVGTVLLLLFTTFGSFKAYEYTETDEFCGTVCHKVMEPEYTAYKSSPHARVGCVQCHIGSGAGWFVKSKLSGSYQVYSVLFNKYPTPIPTPIENLRPAQETCEQCHWPKNFFGEKRVVHTYYHSNEENNKWSVNLLLKVGGGVAESGATTGIHWHMNIANEITYVTSDKARQVIPWVKSRSKNGNKEVIYRSIDSVKLSDEDLKKYETRKMDCMDCHNRPAHVYNPPAKSVNNVMSLGWIDPSLPFIKSIAVEVLEKSYTNLEIAKDSIKFYIEQFYNNNYPSEANEKKDAIEKSISEIQKIYSQNYFPEMNVSWRHYPNNIGHMYFAGCFRCHDGKHVSDAGKVLTKDCNACHTILAQEFSNKEIEFSLKGLEYKHPVDIGDSWKNILCSDCHAAKK